MFEKEDLRKILADTILTINGRHSYHMEAQMEEDETIILRVFDYSYSHAMRNATDRTGGYSIRFPEPKVIYLYAAKNIPDEYVLNLELLKKLIQDDIIKSINQNLELGNITVWDARKLRLYTHKLYEHIYSRYEELKELKDVIADKDEILTEKNKELDQKDKELSIKDEEINAKDKEIEKLREMLAKAGFQE